MAFKLIGKSKDDETAYYREGELYYRITAPYEIENISMIRDETLFRRLARPTMELPENAASEYPIFDSMTAYIKDWARRSFIEFIIDAAALDMDPKQVVASLAQRELPKILRLVKTHYLNEEKLQDLGRLLSALDVNLIYPISDLSETVRAIDTAIDRLEPRSRPTGSPIFMMALRQVPKVPENDWNCGDLEEEIKETALFGLSLQ